ncbi:hypothetical protein Plim_2364 [Planctopirus limnophila DSM 3776]|uniref:Uncharacterized protein n=1 Tax=Planctopirus limnophila (strain ATCC 43296 / DSM 3776 / IFAM 1008 / Mu 290) TaxID=521674 RepID=D5SP46_PLAL2|nr:hypothetical protein [Planctopirus limnophila]ADG68190.1 hypothetical protein Plim_2364 [Planctopirus limnophila DSM 3776]
MSLIDQAERLKRTWTDQYVQVREGIPALTRFRGLTGCVKTVNMNCRLLVEFQQTVDISWYDIDPAHVIRVEAPKVVEPVATTPPIPAAVPQPPVTAAPPETTKRLSPIEMIRAQQAKSANQSHSEGTAPLTKPTASSSPTLTSPPVPAKPLSPIEMIRAQQAKSKSLEASTPQVPPKEELPATPEEPMAPAVVTAIPQKLSPIEMIRAQQAARAKADPATNAAKSGSPLAAEEKLSETVAPQAAKSPIELIREQQKRAQAEVQKPESPVNPQEMIDPLPVAKPLSPMEIIRQQQAAKLAKEQASQTTAED